MPKRINVIIVRVQTTELTVPDDFELTPEALAKVKGATKRLADREEKDSVVDSIMFEVLPDDDQPLAEQLEGVHDTVDTSNSSRTQAFLFAIQTMYVRLHALARSEVEATALTQIYGIDMGAVNSALSANNKPMARDHAEAAFNEWVGRVRDRGLRAFWAESGDTFVVASDDTITDIYDGIEA